jgi:transposase-like protein
MIYTENREAVSLRAPIEAALPSGVSEFAEAGDQFFTFTGFPTSQWKARRTTNAPGRINEEFRRRTRTQTSLPNEEAVLHSWGFCAAAKSNYAGCRLAGIRIQ